MIVSALSIIIPIKGAAPGGDRVASGARSRRRGPSVDRVGDAGVIEHGEPVVGRGRRNRHGHVQGLGQSLSVRLIYLMVLVLDLLV